jgi:hypothetical protein
VEEERGRGEVQGEAAGLRDCARSLLNTLAKRVIHGLTRILADFYGKPQRQFLKSVSICVNRRIISKQAAWDGEERREMVP